MPKPALTDFATILDKENMEPLFDLAWGAFKVTDEDAVAKTPAEAREALDLYTQAEVDQSLSGKVDKSGDTMTGQLTLPATDPTLNNHAARKAYVDAQIDEQYDSKIAATLEAIYPIGSLYFCAAATDPNSALPGTWTLLTEGQFLVSAGGTGDYALGETGGAEEVTLSDAQMSHKHKTAMGYDNGLAYGLLAPGNIPPYGSEIDSAGCAKITVDSVSTTGRIAYTHKNERLDAAVPSPHENRPPYLAVNMWQRTA